MRIVISASKEFLEKCMEANQEVAEAVLANDQEAYLQALTKQTIYGIALLQQIGTKEMLGPMWEAELAARDHLPHS